MDQRYLKPPKDFNIDGYIPFLRILISFVMIVGGIVIVVSLIYLAAALIKAVYGVTPLKGKYIKIAIWALIIGMLLLSGGWLTWLKFFHIKLFPSKIL